MKEILDKAFGPLPKRVNLVVRIPPEMMQHIQEAEEITNETRTRIVEDCVRMALPDVVDAILSEHREQRRLAEESRSEFMRKTAGASAARKHGKHPDLPNSFPKPPKRTTPDEA